MNKTEVAGKNKKIFMEMQEKGIFLHEFQYPLALFEDIEKAMQTDRLVQSEKHQVNDLIDQYSTAAKEVRKRLKSLCALLQTITHGVTLPSGTKGTFGDLPAKYDELGTLITRENAFLRQIDENLTKLKNVKAGKEVLTFIQSNREELIKRLEYLYSIHFEHNTGTADTAFFASVKEAQARKCIWVKKVLSFYNIDVSLDFIMKLLQY